MNKIKLQSVKKTFNSGAKTLTVLHNLSYQFEQGKSYAITGPSGVGKSTLMHVIAGIDAPTTGKVSYNDQWLAAFTAHERYKWFNTTIGLVFQQPYLIKELSVKENVLLKAFVDSNAQDSSEEATYLINVVGLSEKIDAMPASLSGGQQQRVALARSLLHKPSFLLADELTGNLDEKTGAHIIDILLEYQQKYTMGLIMSSHDQYVTKHMQTVLVLREGLLTRVAT